MAAPRHLAAVLLAAIAFTAHGEEEGPRGRRLLVLLDDLAARSSHSAFFGSLQARGFDLDFRLADDPNLSLHRYGQYLYGGLVLFAPSTTHEDSLPLQLGCPGTSFIAGGYRHFLSLCNSFMGAGIFNHWRLPPSLIVIRYLLPILYHHMVHSQLLPVLLNAVGWQRNCMPLPWTEEKMVDTM